MAHIFAHRDEYRNKQVLCGGYYTTMEEIAAAIARVTGKTVVYKQSGIPEGTPQEFIDTFRLFNEYGYYNGEDISEAQRIHPSMKSFEEWLREAGVFVD